MTVNGNRIEMVDDQRLDGVLSNLHRTIAEKAAKEYAAPLRLSDGGKTRRRDKSAADQ